MVPGFTPNTGWDQHAQLRRAAWQRGDLEIGKVPWYHDSSSKRSKRKRQTLAFKGDSSKNSTIVLTDQYNVQNILFQSPHHLAATYCTIIIFGNFSFQSVSRPRLPYFPLSTLLHYIRNACFACKHKKCHISFFGFKHRSSTGEVSLCHI